MIIHIYKFDYITSMFCLNKSCVMSFSLYSNQYEVVFFLSFCWSSREYVMWLISILNLFCKIIS